MQVKLYDLLCVGIVEGENPERVKAAFTQMFGVESKKVELIFAAREAVLKTGVDAVTAEKYIARLASIGVIVSMRASDAAPSSASELSLMPIVTTISQEDVDGYKERADDSDEDGERNGFVSASAMHQTVAPVYGDDTRRIPFEFSGKGFEYFKIWIVNILLSIVTIGIYSAWAKVRNKQYFYGNTSLASASFEYTAEPLKILKGRLIAMVFFIAYSFFVKTSPVVAGAMGLLLLIFLPWIIVSSLKFNARHSSYRNINFRFVGSIGTAAKCFILWPLLAVFTLGILFPFVWKKQTKYVTSNHLYGTAPFTFSVEVKEYYKMLLLLIAGCAVVVIMTFTFDSVFMGLAAGDVANIGKAAPVIIACVAMYIVAIAYFVVTMNNIHFNNTQLHQHRFVSTWSTGSYAILLFTNTLGILLTLGLFIPFAKVRTAAYKAAHMAFIVSGGMEHFIAAEQEQSNALGEGVHDIFDIDISL
ncbi:MAG: YjgN family protein [Pseudomonadota bacterium]